MARRELECDGTAPFPVDFRPPTRALPFAQGRQPPGFDVDPEEAPRALRDHLRVLVAYRRLALGCFLGTVVLAVLATVFMPRRYTATTRLQVPRQASIQLRLADSVRRGDEGDGGGTGAATFIATQVAALESRDLAERVINARGLAANEAFVHPANGQGGLLARAGDVLASLRPRGWEVPAAAGPSAGDPAGTRVDPRLLDRYMKYLSVREVRGTDLVDVSFTTPDAALAAFLAAAHTQAFIEANDEARRATDAVAERFLDEQLADVHRQLERAEQALAGYAAEHPDVAVDQEQKVAGTRIAELSSLVTKAEAERSTLESRYQFLTGADADPLAYLLEQPGVQKLRLALLDVRAQRAALGQRLGPNHPQMEELAVLEAAVQQELRGEVVQDVAAVRSRYEAARLREEALRGRLARHEEAGAELRALGARYDVLRRDVDTARKLHASLLTQRVETRVSAALSEPTLRVIERAEVPVKPSRPKVVVNLALGVLAGLVLALGAVFGSDHLDTSVKSTEEVEDLLHLPTLAAIPNFALARRAAGRDPAPEAAAPRTIDRDELPVLHEPWSRVAEAFRNMRTAVLFSAAGTPPKLILVTSARPAEGKTVASLNLASTLAELGARVLLVDADLRHPRCHAALGVSNDRGLTTWLAGEDDLDGLLHALDAPGLFFLPAGPPPRNPADLVGSARMRLGLDRLRSRFDFVVVDTPPVLPVTDAVVLAREADGVVLVVKGHETPREVVRRARDRLVLAGARFLGVMVNNVGVGWGDAYSYDTYGGDRRPPAGEQRV